MTALLVIDDDLDVLTAVSDLLEVSGFLVHRANGIPDALYHLHTLGSTLALVLSDIRLNAHDGYWIADQVIAMYPHLPVILMSGFPTVPDDPRAHRWPIMRKPFHIRDLLAVFATHGVRP